MLLIIGVNGTTFGQVTYKFKELPLNLQNSVLASVQKRLIDSKQDTVLRFVDTVTVRDTSNHSLDIFNFFVGTFASGDSTIIEIRCTRTNLIVGDDRNSIGTFLRNQSTRGAYYSSGYATTYTTAAKLSFVCMDASHVPHHSAMTLKEMEKLQAKYHCKKITTLIIDY